MNRILAAISSLVLASGLSPDASAQDKPEVLVKQRQAAMTLQGKYFGPLAGMLRDAVPYDSQVVAGFATYLDALAAMPWDGFPDSTREVKSRALPAVWSERAKFDAARDEFLAAVDVLATVSRGGDRQQVRKAIESVGATCRGCHDDFRSK